MADNPHKAHRQRMRAQYLSQGPSSFLDHQLVEMLLFFGIPQGDTNPLAHALLDRFHSIHAILQATPTQLMEVKGVGEHTAVLLNLCGALVKKCGEEWQPAGKQLQTTKDYSDFLLPRFFGLTNETVILLSLNNRREVLNCSVVTEGSVNATEVSLRLILQQVLTDNATKAVISHNHPAGHAIPSRADITTTIQLASMLSAVGVQLLDHIIVASGDCVSMRDTPTLTHIFAQQPLR